MYMHTTAHVCDCDSARRLTCGFLCVPLYQRRDLCASLYPSVKASNGKSNNLYTEPWPRALPQNVERPLLPSRDRMRTLTPETVEISNGLLLSNSTVF